MSQDVPVLICKLCGSDVQVCRTKRICGRCLCTQLASDIETGAFKLPDGARVKYPKVKIDVKKFRNRPRYRGAFELRSEETGETRRQLTKNILRMAKDKGIYFEEENRDAVDVETVESDQDEVGQAPPKLLNERTKHDKDDL